MLKFFCDCGSEVFEVNRRCSAVQCVSCRKKFALVEDRWEQLKVSLPEKILDKAQTTFEYLSNTAGDSVETMGSWLKRHGIVRGKKPKISFSTPELPRIIYGEEAIEQAQLTQKWNFVISQLNVRGKFFFGKNMHFGQLRGRNIAVLAHRDLKKIGYQTKLKFVANYAAVLEAVNGSVMQKV